MTKTKKNVLGTSGAGQEKKFKAHRPKYKDDMRKAYDIGYAHGWDGAYDIPKRMGARKAAAMGYHKGVRNRKKSDKYVSQYKRRG